MTNTDIKRRASELNGDVLRRRRWLHQHPELSFEEKGTTAYIVKELEAMGVETKTFPDYNGAVGVIRGGRPGGTVALRADIDALPTQEATGLAFASEVPGKTHSCGHDAHAAMLLTAAQILSEMRGELPGTVLLLFQAAEESCKGSRYYLDCGALDGVQAIFGMHVWGDMEAPLVNFQQGFRMASCDNFRATVHGCSSHGSTPHLAKDAIVAASAVILALQTYASRRNDPLNPFALTVGTVKAGTQFNIITDAAVMEGTIRTFDPAERAKLKATLSEIINGAAASMGCTAELELDAVEPAVINSHDALTETARGAAEKIFGKEALCDSPPVMASEDFSLLMEKIPGVFGFIGCLNAAKGIIAPNHSDKFTVDEAILPLGAALYAQFACDFLTKEGAE